MSRFLDGENQHVDGQITLMLFRPTSVELKMYIPQKYDRFMLINIWLGVNVRLLIKICTTWME